MSDDRVVEAPAYSGALLAAIAVAVLAALGGLGWSYALSNRLTRQEAALSEANQQNAKLDAQLRETNARLRVATDELGRSVGMTQKQLDARAQQIIAHEAAENKRLDDRAEADRATGQRGAERRLKREDRCWRRQNRSHQDADRFGNGGKPAHVDEGRSEQPLQPDCAQSAPNSKC